jgi:hypothetical protein
MNGAILILILLCNNTDYCSIIFTKPIIGVVILLLYVIDIPIFDPCETGVSGVPSSGW